MMAALSGAPGPRPIPRGEIARVDVHPGTRDSLWRLSKKLDVLELARVIGHRDLRSLLIYYQADADALADKL